MWFGEVGVGVLSEALVSLWQPGSGVQSWAQGRQFRPAVPLGLFEEPSLESGFQSSV